MQPLQTNQSRSGYSLLELLLVVSIAALLALGSAPSLARWQADKRAHATLLAIASDIAHARRLAHHSPHAIVLCPSADGVGCDSTADFSHGWIVFRDTTQSRPARREPNERILTTGTPEAGVQLVANRQQFEFTAHVLRSTNGTITACDRARRIKAKRLVVSYTGRARFATSDRNQC